VSNEVKGLVRDYSSARTAFPVACVAIAEDGDALYALPIAGVTGLTSLSADRDALASRPNASEHTAATAETRETRAI